MHITLQNNTHEQANQIGYGYLLTEHLANYIIPSPSSLRTQLKLFMFVIF